MEGHLQFTGSNTPNENISAISSLLEAKTGKSIEELMESGRLLRADGERFLPEGAKVQHDKLIFGLPEEIDAFYSALCKDGVLYFDDVDSGDHPMPCYLYEKHTNQELAPNFYMTDTLDENGLQQLAEEQIQKIEPVEARVSKPGFWNRLVDSVRRFFGMSGTPEMDEYRSDAERVEFWTNSDASKRAKWEKMPDKLRAQSKALANLSVSERNKDKEMSAVENALRPEAMGVNKDDVEFYEEFKETMLDMANNSFMIRGMLLHLGKEHELQGGKSVTSELRQVYKAYVTERGNGRDLDLREMMNTATSKPEQVGNLDRILDNQKVVSAPTQAALK